jgi:hypothetical protein
LEEDFDADKYDQKMKEVFNQDYYYVDGDDEKPEFPYDPDIDDGAIQIQLDKYSNSKIRLLYIIYLDHLLQKIGMPTRVKKTELDRLQAEAMTKTRTTTSRTAKIPISMQVSLVFHLCLFPRC